MAPQSPTYTASGSLTEHFNSAVATTACSTMCLAVAAEVERLLQFSFSVIFGDVVESRPC